MRLCSRGRRDRRRRVFEILIGRVRAAVVCDGTVLGNGDRQVHGGRQAVNADKAVAVIASRA
ncbi:hypothetical protein SDC9_114844 [bioreactor metagenome]|uniref:Uncharacterized protein n=1 Tax=bioreactor metagenome TaxID=1076179 RepID=A0A645BR67_9ZZZZ